MWRWNFFVRVISINDYSLQIGYKMSIVVKNWKLIKNVNISSESAGNNNVNVTTRKFVSDNNVNDPQLCLLKL